ncbi:MAG: triose-phosphate isomerase [Anaerolineae bacterium]
MRTPIIAGNWKMQKTAAESVAFVKELTPALAPYTSAERVVCPTFVALVGVAEALKGTDIKVGAQNVSTALSGRAIRRKSPSACLKASSNTSSLDIRKFASTSVKPTP